MYGDNMSVVTNSSKPESTLKRKSNLICYHGVREAVAMNEVTANQKHPYTTRTLTNRQSVREDYGRFGEYKGGVWETLHIV